MSPISVTVRAFAWIPDQVRDDGLGELLKVPGK